MPTFNGTAAGETLTGTTNADDIHGLGGNDNLVGLAGADLLDGGEGADSLSGGDGDDRYIIDNLSDTITEAAGQGDDVLHTSVSYVLGAGVSVETMTTMYAGGTSALDLTGNEFGQSIYGNAGRNVLNGGGGVDYLVGLGGNDHYIVDHYSDYALEADGEGDDWVSASASYTLAAGSSIETLNTTDASSTQAIFLGGNEFGQSIYGNAGNNYLYGLGGADYLVGLDGNDVLNGGQGNDYLMGGAGADVFHFDNNGSVDTIGDFDGSDYINLGSFLGFQQFQFIGSSAFTGWPGQGRFADGKFELDVNGDGIPELTVNVHGTVTATSFVFWDDFI